MARELPLPVLLPLRAAFPLLLLILILYLEAVASASRPEVITATRGTVAADDRRCSKVGRDVLRDGGHAVDAAVATALCLGVVSPASSGIGGGAFMLVRLANGEAQAFDMRETAPAAASKNMYANNAALKASGSLSVAVPGELAGLYRAWKQHGALPWKRLVRPAANLARRGFKISPYLQMQMNKTKADIFSDTGLRHIFTENGSLLQFGDTCRNKKLARTLDAIAEHGPDVLYRGTVGLALTRDIKKSGGLLTMEDLHLYKVKVHDPISAEVMGFNILGMPPPSSGGAGLVLILNILAQYGIPSGVFGTLGFHRYIEALKHMFALRMNLGDPDYVNVSQVLYDMLSPKFAQDMKKTIFDNRTFPPDYYGGRWNVIHDHGTSHICVVDKWRNAISMTTTVNAYFGSRFLSPSTGILLNNEMDDFSVPNNSSLNVTPLTSANFIAPFKRPLSSMAPTIILKDGQLNGVLGASGGAMIIAGVGEVFLNHFAKGMDPLSSILAPRFYHQLIPNVVQYENWTTVTGDHFELPDSIRVALQKKGHVLEGLAGGTICQFVVHNLQKSAVSEDVTFGELTAVSDPRKGGLPAGY